MAMLGMQADMQCHYFPGYCSTRDLNLNASCSSWPSNNVDKISKNGHYFNGNLASPFPDHYLTYKEKVKQTMLRHEAIFRDQIHELHRLYNRQRELMAEMKRVELHGRHLRLETPQSNQIFSENSFECFQRTHKASSLPWLNPAFIQSSISGTENSQLHLNYIEGKIIQDGCSTFQTEGSRKETGLLESKCKKVGKRILDLELPADEYIDSEEEESLASETAPPEVSGYPMKSMVEDVQKSYVELFRGISDGNLVFQDDSMAQAPFSRKTKCLADLNEPIKLEEEVDPESNDFLGPVLDHSSDMNSFPERICTETLSTSSEDDEIEQAHEISTSYLLNLNSGKLHRERSDFGLESYPEKVATACKHTSSELIPLDDVKNHDSSLVSSWRKHTRDIVRTPIAVQALPCFNSVPLSRSSKFRSPEIPGGKSCSVINLESGPTFCSISAQSSSCDGDNEFASEASNTQKHTKGSVDLKLTRGIDLNSMSPSCSSDVAAHGIWITDGEEKCKESTGGSPLLRENPAHLVKSNKKLQLDCNSVPESEEQINDLVFGSRCCEMSSGFRLHVDLNSCMNEDDSSPMPTLSAEIDLQAPASPENKETSPPRGESDENQLDMPCQLPEQENRDLLEDLITVAAEAIVSISSSQIRSCTETVTFKPSEASQNDPLYWFSKIASSVVDDPESEFGVVLSFKNTDNHDEYLSDGIDYFEAMTLKLKETKAEPYFCKTRVLKEEAACPASLPIQPRRGQTRRGRQQRKDFQSEILPSLASLSRYEVTEDLHAIGGLIEAAHQNTGARRTGRNVWMSGRRRRSSISPSQAETSLCSLLKQQTTNGKYSIEESSLIGWGKITRRRRGPRCPATNPRLILSQV
ncbi:hypothetical protein P3X46_031151 [Hevea brasiliensis]|uniref:Uncharacterized protein n=1 Tax=Hevea brasiliensis TaxID=3981 RepID=A0ABQ9KKX6_HEVBR|nr:uncharacterized protein LOC110656922 [Hevea brasiliensis]XP_057995363.1 uncharacterized protein LOC110656922 [Hevea brasiliensis]XP_057995364.1 uncharacterized protein LOC110656922 [Hevea brasiliensis]KAJ9140510.1 hypothetical protein P3X46_031151 [Hevea brasiliensis]KAJ9140511.1 hypothetical protein P3X46_031151 [Hevea brasiliensis]KAJ9140512.1 hypothetical protein P3X46_031151 [Hevea brasiliensis]